MLACRFRRALSQSRSQAEIEGAPELHQQTKATTAAHQREPRSCVSLLRMP